MNKNVWLGILVTLALASGVAALYDSTNDGAISYTAPYGDVYVVQLRYEPFPVSPGQYVDIWYKIDNRGDTDLQDLSFTILPDFPFSIDSNDVATKQLGTLAAHSSALIMFKVRVSESALQGDQPLKYTWKAAGEDRAPVLASTLSVRSANSMLVISDVKATPEVITPGTETEIEIEVANVGDSFLRFVTGNLQLVAVSGGVVVELPFTPQGTGVSQLVTNVAPGENATLRFPILANADAKSQSYKVPIIITYLDSAGRNLSRSEIVGITVHAEPDIMVYVDKNDLRDEKTPADAVLRFVNKGRSDIKFLTVTIQESGAYTIINSPAQYVGEVNSDDYETASWTLKLTKTARSVDLPLIVAYEDANGKKYSTGLTVTMPIHTLADLGQQRNGYGNLLVALVIIIVIGYFIYRRRNKKRA